MNYLQIVRAELGKTVAAPFPVLFFCQDFSNLGKRVAPNTTRPRPYGSVLLFRMSTRRDSSAKNSISISFNVVSYDRCATGPITAEGKGISVQNARRHGLNVPSDEYLVSVWFNVIPDNGEDALEEPNASDP